ncbi:3-deoxy-D-manno-octulosonic acid transferase [Mucilaginibacter gotjawali]|uniref:3-deoxy-D-manno-octulosonic-acid transferase n=2 Tax=Mucilaginibacter gotjawali TaxID=1550579 RepID=A0A839SMZ7_9SPHI|nr:glycosyltransferase N-terminal domain-containing protein [Mucilaginibacter gotjawali]MBB3057859.1 3-deoxy-D-manno-octulosonic-acid transferase [Mucilaginibacter gotjawali]BAU52369.1 3-deoxy-D-manno-octulosonic acid transferase [Mucilaginibacter gotjawali]
MLLIYNAAIRLYFVVVWIFSFFNKKAKLWISGRSKQSFVRQKDAIWFHFSSLGEFEQGRPVLEAIRQKYPENKIVITFFSPSGYEVRKNTILADAVYYLPLDTARNAKEFLDLIQPKLVIFTKYEYWYNFFKEMYRRDIPLYIISGIFRPGQIFFKWYGGLHRKMLGFVTWFFVQDDKSKQLLKKIGKEQVTVSGDTRFDRVWQNALAPKELPQIAAFKNGQKVFIAGSTWPEDEYLLAELVAGYPGWKFIIAPHEIDNDQLDRLMELLPTESSARYSIISSLNGNFSNLRVLVIDNIGMLSSLYRYGEIAYIGGGFGAGIHNTLEAAAFGLPVIFGPNYTRFKEANDLVALKVGFSITNGEQLTAIMETLVNDDAFYSAANKKILTYVKEHTGATNTILNHIEKK